MCSGARFTREYVFAISLVGTGKLSAHLEYVLSYGNDVHQHNISTNRRRSGDQTDEVSQYESITL